MNLEASTPPEDGTSTETTSPEWLGSLPEDLTVETKGEDGAVQNLPLAQHPKLAEFKSVGDLAKSYLGAQELIGRKAVGLVPPKADASDEDKAAFDKELRGVLGVPDAPDGYELKMAEGVDADETLVNWFKGTAHGLGLSPQQAQGLTDAWNTLSGEFLKQQEAEEAKAREDAKASLAQLWGDEAPAKAEAAKRGFAGAAKKAGIADEEAEAFMQAHGDNPVVLRVFSEFGKAFMEDGAASGSGSAGGAAPSSEQFFAEDVFGG